MAEEATEQPVMGAQYSTSDLLEAARNAKEAGDIEASKVFIHAAYQQRMKEEQFNPTDDMSTLGKLGAGVGRGMKNVARHASNLIGITPDSSISDANALDAPLLDTTPGAIGNFIGETAATALPVSAPTAAVARLGTLGAKLAGNALGRGAIEGSLQATLMADPESRDAQTAGAGALFGMALPAGFKAGKTLVKGLSRTPAAQSLLDRGVGLTPGLMNPNSVMGSFEQMPVVSQLVRGARANAKGDWNRAVAEASAAPGTKVKPGSMDEMLDEAYQSFEPLYAQGKGFPASAVIMNAKGPDVHLADAFRAAARVPGNTKSVQNSTESWLLSNLQARLSKARSSGKGMTSDDLLELRSDIRQQARTYGRQADTAAPMYKEAYDRADDAITKALESQLPPDAMDAVRVADSHYKNYKTLEDAVFASKDRDAGITPHELSSALASNARGLNKGQHARGRNLNELRELARAGSEVFALDPQMRTGASFWPTTLAGLGLMAKPGLTIPAAAGTLALSLTPGGRAFSAGQLGVQKRLADLSSKYFGGMTPLNKQLAENYLQRSMLSLAGPGRE